MKSKHYSATGTWRNFTVSRRLYVFPHIAIIPQEIICVCSLGFTGPNCTDIPECTLYGCGTTCYEPNINYQTYSISVYFTYLCILAVVLVVIFGGMLAFRYWFIRNKTVQDQLFKMRRKRGCNKISYESIV